jgi:hypothetical protein
MIILRYINKVFWCHDNEPKINHLNDNLTYLRMIVHSLVKYSHNFVSFYYAYGSLITYMMISL